MKDPYFKKANKQYVKISKDNREFLLKKKDDIYNQIINLSNQFNFIDSQSTHPTKQDAHKLRYLIKGLLGSFSQFNDKFDVLIPALTKEERDEKIDIQKIIKDIKKKEKK